METLTTIVNTSLSLYEWINTLEEQTNCLGHTKYIKAIIAIRYKQFVAIIKSLLKQENCNPIYKVLVNLEIMIK